MYLKFRYLNWNGADHVYVIDPEPEITFGYHGGDSEDNLHWQIHGELITRDGDPRPEMGPTRRRSFKMASIREMEQVER